MIHNEPMHETSARSTASSNEEGRMKSSLRKKKKKYIKKAIIKSKYA